MTSVSIGSTCTRARAKRFLDRRGLPHEGFVAFRYPLAIEAFAAVPPPRAVKPGTYLLDVESGVLLVSYGGNESYGAREWRTSCESPILE
jgi:hypothetical protein